MGRISIPRRFDALNSRWLRQEQQLLQPSFVGDEIGWTSEWLPGTLLYEQEFNFETVTSAAGVSFIDGSTVADGEVIMVVAASAFHGDAASRYISFGIKNSTNGNAAYVTSSESTIPTSTLFSMNRPILIPEGHNLICALNTIAAGFTVTLRYYYLRLRFGEPIPRH